LAGQGLGDMSKSAMAPRRTWFGGADDAAATVAGVTRSEERARARAENDQRKQEEKVVCTFTLWRARHCRVPRPSVLGRL